MITKETVQRSCRNWGDGLLKKTEPTLLARLISKDIYIDVNTYLSQLLPEEGYFTGSVNIHTAEQIEVESEEGAWPGCILYRFNYIPIAVTIGGSQVCVSCEDGKVYFADRSYISDRWVMFENDAGQLESHELNAENLRRSMPLVSTDLELFFTGMLDHGLNDRLDSLDEG